jgi:hypothetical protein
MYYLLKKLYRHEYFKRNWHFGLPSHYFEDCYFKTVFSDRPFTLIPGVSLSAEDAHGFIYVTSGLSFGNEILSGTMWVQEEEKDASLSVSYNGQSASYTLHLGTGELTPVP